MPLSGLRVVDLTRILTGPVRAGVRSAAMIAHVGPATVPNGRGAVGLPLCCLLLVSKNSPYRLRNIGWRERGGRDLVQKRLKQMVIVAVDHGHIDRGLRQRARRFEPAEAGADNNHMWSLAHPALHQFQSPTGEDLTGSDIGISESISVITNIKHSPATTPTRRSRPGLIESGGPWLWTMLITNANIACVPT